MGGTKRAADGAETARERDLRAARDRFLAFAFAAADLLLEVEASGRILFALGAARQIVGRDPAALAGTPFFDLVAGEDRRMIAVLLGGLVPGSRVEPIICRLGAEEGGAATVILSGHRVQADGPAYLALSLARPIPAERALAHRRDRQTGLLEVADFRHATTERLRNAADVGADVRLTLLDLCGLDTLLQRLGPEQADELLVQIGATLRAHSVGGDSAGQIAEGRIGVVHDGATDAEAMRAAVERLGREADSLGEGISVAGRTVDLQPGRLSVEDGTKAVSYVISRFAEVGASALEIGSAADGLRLLLADTVERISAFRHTVASRSFRLVFQPIVHLAGRDTHHFEALSRIEGTSSPFETIRFAEGLDIVEEFDLAVVERVLSLLDERPASAGPVSIAVNLSGRSVENSLFLGALDAILDRHPAARRSLMFEITESTQISDLDLAARFVGHLKAGGHAVCLDDFGAGAASFPYLQALPVDFVKIDGAYVKRALEEPRDRAIMRSIARLASDLGIRTVAEMIETEDQAALIEGLGVDLGQGWLFGPPVPDLPAGEAKVLPRLTDPSRRR